MRILILAFTTLSLAFPGFAQPLQGQGDPTNTVSASGDFPEGWMVRFDARRRGPAATVADVDFRPMGSDLHITSGPAATYYHVDDVSGDYTLRATFSQGRSMSHESYGLVIGGSDLQGPNQTYLYFIIRPNGGVALINHRTSDERPRKIVDFTAFEGIDQESTDDGSATNTIAIQVEGENVHFMVNDQTFRTMTKAELGGVVTDGMVGIRINHNLDLHIADFEVRR